MVPFQKQTIVMVLEDKEFCRSIKVKFYMLSLDEMCGINLSLLKMILIAFDIKIM